MKDKCHQQLVSSTCHGTSQRDWWSKRSQQAKQPDTDRESQFLATSPALDAPIRGFTLVYCHNVWYGKTRMVWLPDGEKVLKICLFISTEHTTMTDRRTDKRTPRDTSGCARAKQLYDCIVPYVDIILHRGRFWAKSAASGNIRWCCIRSCWMVLSHVMWGWPGCLLQSTGKEANRILLASALSSMHIIWPNRVSRHDWIIAVSLGCFVSLRTSSFHTNWYHLMPSSIRRHHWSSASILCASILRASISTQPSSPNHIGILVRCTCCTASISLRLQDVTSKSDFLSSAWQHEWRHFGGWCHKCFWLLSG